jgi:hypothetical protein
MRLLGDLDLEIRYYQEMTYRSTEALRHPKASFSPNRFSSVQVVRHRNPSSACGKQSSAGSHDNRSQNRKPASDEKIGSCF